MRCAPNVYSTPFPAVCLTSCGQPVRKPVTPCIPCRRIAPLALFGEESRRWIQAESVQPTKPPKWISYGNPADARPIAQLVSRAWYEWHYRRGRDPDLERDPIPTHVRAAVLRRDGFVCQICRGRVERGDVHLDHITPWSKGGLDTVPNLRVTHSRCNLRKGAS